MPTHCGGKRRWICRQGLRRWFSLLRCSSVTECIGNFRLELSHEFGVKLLVDTRELCAGNSPSQNDREPDYRAEQALTMLDILNSKTKTPLGCPYSSFWGPDPIGLLAR